jgi:uncharacterized protein YrrD
MEKYSEVIGLPVICINDGKKIGNIKDVIFCTTDKDVKAFLLERKGCQISSKAIALKDVLSLGKDALIVSDCTCAKSLNKLKGTINFKNRTPIKGLKVYSRNGDELGIVGNILFDYKTGKIEGVEVSDGLLKDIVKGRNIVPLFGNVEFSEENILVEKEAVEEMMNTGGGLKKYLD